VSGLNAKIVIEAEVRVRCYRCVLTSAADRNIFLSSYIDYSVFQCLSVQLYLLLAPAGQQVIVDCMRRGVPEETELCATSWSRVLLYGVPFCYILKPSFSHRVSATFSYISFSRGNRSKLTDDRS